MAPKSPSFKRLQQRFRRSLCYGNRRMKSLPLPLSELAVNYFDKHSPYDYMNMDFATSLARDGCVDACTFLLAMVYLDRMRTTDKNNFEASDPGELYLSALIIAGKYLHDSGQSEFIYNDEWALSASTSLKRVNELELNMLDAIRWDANVSSVEFMRMLEKVEIWIARDSFAKRGFCTYNETAVFASKINLLSDCVKPLILSFATFTVVYSAAIVSLITAPQIAISLNTQRFSFKSDDTAMMLRLTFITNSWAQRLETDFLQFNEKFYWWHKSDAGYIIQASSLSSIATGYDVPVNRTVFTV